MESSSKNNTNPEYNTLILQEGESLPGSFCV